MGLNDEAEHAGLDGPEDFINMLSHLETSLKDAAHDLALDEADKNEDDSRDLDDDAPKKEVEDEEGPFPVDLLKDVIGHIVGEEGQRPVVHPVHTLGNIRVRLPAPQVRHIVVTRQAGGPMPPLNQLLCSIIPGLMPAGLPTMDGVHPHVRMMVMMHPHAFNPHLMIPPSFAMAPPPFVHTAPPMSLGHMLPPNGLQLPPIHFRMMVHGAPHGPGGIPSGLPEVLNELIGKRVAAAEQAMAANEVLANSSSAAHVRVVRVNPTLSTMAKKAAPAADEDRRWDSEDITDGMKFSTALPGVNADAVKVQVKKDLLRVTGKDADKKEFAFVYPVKFEIDPSTVVANLKGGVLTVSVHRKPAAANHRSGIQWTSISRRSPLLA